MQIKSPKPEPAIRHANLINVSGHRLPSSVFTYLKHKGYKEYSVYTPNVAFEMSEDLWQQCESILDELVEIRDKTDKNVFDRDDTYNLLFIPAISAGAILLANGISKIIGIPPDLAVVSRVAKKPELVQILDLRAWEANCRNKLRYKYTISPAMQGQI